MTTQAVPSVTAATGAAAQLPVDDPAPPGQWGVADPVHVEAFEAVLDRPGPAAEVTVSNGPASAGGILGQLNDASQQVRHMMSEAERIMTKGADVSQGDLIRLQVATMNAHLHADIVLKGARDSAKAVEELTKLQ